jgi:hypothetical protein
MYGFVSGRIAFPTLSYNSWAHQQGDLLPLNAGMFTFLFSVEAEVSCQCSEVLETALTPGKTQGGGIQPSVFYHLTRWKQLAGFLLGLEGRLGQSDFGVGGFKALTWWETWGCKEMLSQSRGNQGSTRHPWIGGSAIHLAAQPKLQAP